MVATMAIGITRKPASFADGTVEVAILDLREINLKTTFVCDLNISQTAGLIFVKLL